METLAWGAIILFLIYKGWKWIEAKRPENRIARLEELALRRKNYALEDTMKLGREIQSFVLEGTERDYIRLKERNAHDMPKRVQLAEDWLTYTEALMEISSARDMLNVDMGENPLETFEESVKEPHIKRQEVERRFQEALGETYQDRWLQFLGKEQEPLELDLGNEPV